MPSGTTLRMRCQSRVTTARFCVPEYIEPGPSYVTSWKIAPRPSSGVLPVMTPRRLCPCSVGSSPARPPSALSTVGMMSTWPAGVTTRRGATPGMRMMSGTLVSLA